MRHYESVHYSTADIEYNMLKKSLMLRLLPRPPNCLNEVFGSNSLSACEVTRSDLRVDFNSRVHRDKVFWMGPGIRNQKPS